MNTIAFANAYKKVEIMQFDVNQTTFISPYQRDVWSAAIHVVPLDISLAKIADRDTRNGCTQVYYATMELLTDMYRNPQDYQSIPPIFYLERFLGWHRYGERQVPVNVRKRQGMYELILDRMKRFGFSLDGETLINTRYPLFTTYWELLAKSCSFNSGMHLCDFRLLVKPYKRTTDDLLRSLPDTYKLYWRELYEYAVRKGAKLESRKDHMFRFVYKKRFVLTLTNTPPNVEIPYNLGGGWNDKVPADLTLFLDIARNQPDADKLIDYIQDNFCVCNMCNGIKSVARRCTNWVDIDGKRRLTAICHLVIGRVKHGPRREPYTAWDVTMLKRMMDLRFLQIDN
jgi:hypothetical protein